MHRWFSLFLLIGALAGLFGQETAYAAASAAPMLDRSTAEMPMSADCAEMMGIGQQDRDVPCSGMSLDCVAKMGCAGPVALIPAAPTETADVLGLPAPTVSIVAPLSGRSQSPELHPPSVFG